ncbi:Uncharacterized protein ALO68_05709 [Pseudomonas syringae pv. helianthi]|uniref:Uncharacterized protein n=1 Tax=Pseudomonas syringae pv. helianthi TaxID=251654 RepID=A0A0P9TKU0_9PSED|nr:Uncharacterized protein ALO68_05709 [Pseudomonas syringae pv. helianthi]
MGVLRQGTGTVHEFDGNRNAAQWENALEVFDADQRNVLMDFLGVGDEVPGAFITFTGIEHRRHTVTASRTHDGADVFRGLGVVKTDAGVPFVGHGEGALKKTGDYTAASEQCYRLCSEPHAHADHQSRVLGIFVVLTRVIGGLAVRAVPAHPDIRGELRRDLVAQPEAELAGRQARTVAALRVVLAVEVELCGGLQYQVVGQQKVIVGFKAGGRLSGFTNKGGCFDIKVRNRLTLQAKGCPGLRRAGLEVLARAGDNVPPRTDRVAPQCLDFRFLCLAVGSLAFGAQQQTVYVAANPAGQVPGQRTAVVGVLPFQLVGQKITVDGAVMDLMACVAGIHRRPVGIGDGRDRGSAPGGRSLCRGRILAVAGIHVHRMAAMIHAFHHLRRQRRGPRCDGQPGGQQQHRQAG